MADAPVTRTAVPSVEPDLPDPYPSLDLLKTLAGLLTFAVAVFFAMGLVVTNFYLVTIGVSDFDLLKARCILTGAWTSLLLFILSIPSFLLVRISRAPTDHDLRKGAAWQIVIVVGLCLLLSLMLGAMLRGKPDFQMLPGFFFCMALISVPALINLYISTILKKHVHTIGAFRLRDTKIRLTVLATLTTVIALFFLAQRFYPSVLPVFGGGKPQRARLVLNEEGVSTWKRILQSSDPDGATKEPITSSHIELSPALTPEVEILYENEARVVVRWKPKDRPVIAVLDRKLLSAIIPLDYWR